MFDKVLERLRASATRPVGFCSVATEDLGELLFHFDRVEGKVRGLEGEIRDRSKWRKTEELPGPPSDNSSVEALLCEGYHLVFVRDIHYGVWTAYVEEWPGCVTQGDTPAEAYHMLRDAMRAWAEVALEHGDEVPPPGEKLDGR